MQDKKIIKTHKANKNTPIKIWGVLGILFFIITVFLAVFSLLLNSEDSSIYDNLKDTIVDENICNILPSSNTATPSTSSFSGRENSFPKPLEYMQPDKYIDFATLKKRNPDVIGWISVDGTDIDYPILQGKDNEYYLKNDIDRKANKVGAIYLDMSNQLTFEDRVSMIYGHNMKSGSMFAQLHKFEDKEFFDKNRKIWIYTEQGMLVYEIIAAYSTDNANPLFNKNFMDNDELEAYVASVMENDIGRKNLKEWDISLRDRILALSTCERNESKKRYIVQGVLLNSETWIRT